MSNSSLYDRKVNGKIKLKGISKLLKKKKKESHDKDGDPEREKDRDSVNQMLGTGRIVSSGTTVQGFETKFVEETAVNDMIVIEHPLTHETEVRFVQSIMSNRTLSIDEPFSVDLITTIPYYISKRAEIEPFSGRSGNPGENETSGDGVAIDLSKKRTSTISIREKAGMWSYKNVTKTVKGSLTAEDKLNERVKQSRDKYCW